MTTKVKLKDISSNPFADKIHRLEDREQVDAIKASIQATTFWDNIVCRKKDGKIEIAYGHTRITALRELYPPDHEITLIVRDLSDEDMLKVLERENSIERRQDFLADMDMFAQAKLFILGQSNLKARYNSDTVSHCNVKELQKAPLVTSVDVARFLGWIRVDGKANKLAINCATATELVASGKVNREDFSGLTTVQAELIVHRTNQRESAIMHQTAAIKKEVAESEGNLAQVIRQVEVAVVADERYKTKQSKDSVKKWRKKEVAAKKFVDRKKEQLSGYVQQTRDATKLDAESIGNALRGKMSVVNLKERLEKEDEEDLRADRPPNLRETAVKAAASLAMTFKDDKWGDALSKKLYALLPYADEIPTATRRDLTIQLDRAKDRLDKYIVVFKSKGDCADAFDQ